MPDCGRMDSVCPAVSPFGTRNPKCGAIIAGSTPRGSDKLAFPAQRFVVGFLIAVIDIIDTGPEGTGARIALQKFALLTDRRNGRDLPVERHASAGARRRQAIGQIAQHAEQGLCRNAAPAFEIGRRTPAFAAIVGDRTIGCLLPESTGAIPHWLPAPPAGNAGRRASRTCCGFAVWWLPWLLNDMPVYSITIFGAAR